MKLKFKKHKNTEVEQTRLFLSQFPFIDVEFHLETFGPSLGFAKARVLSMILFAQAVMAVKLHIQEDKVALLEIKNNEIKLQ